MIAMVGLFLLGQGLHESNQNYLLYQIPERWKMAQLNLATWFEIRTLREMGKYEKKLPILLLITTAINLHTHTQ